MNMTSMNIINNHYKESNSNPNHINFYIVLHLHTKSTKILLKSIVKILKVKLRFKSLTDEKKVTYKNNNSQSNSAFIGSGKIQM